MTSHLYPSPSFCYTARHYQRTNGGDYTDHIMNLTRKLINGTHISRMLVFMFGVSLLISVISIIRVVFWVNNWHVMNIVKLIATFEVCAAPPRIRLDIEVMLVFRQEPRLSSPIWSYWRPLSIGDSSKTKGNPIANALIIKVFRPMGRFAYVESPI